MATPTNLTRLEYSRVYPDANGDTHFGKVAVEQSVGAAAPPAPPFHLSEVRPASGYLFYTFEPGWFGDLHPCPARQFLILLSGEVEMETTDGEVRQFKPGDAVLLEDTWGKGHRTWNTGEGYADYMVVRAPAPP